jgi:TDG/mug DNA glycosylase family protein
MQLLTFITAGMYKEESIEDPYSFVDEDPMLVSQRESASAVKVEGQSSAAPKKRGRKKKIQPPDSEYEFIFLFIFNLMLLTLNLKKNSFDLDGSGLEMPPLTMDLMPLMADGLLGPDGQPSKRKYTKSDHYKQRRRHDRFNGMSEDEVRLRTLPDHLTSNLDVVIVRTSLFFFSFFNNVNRFSIRLVFSFNLDWNKSWSLCRLQGPSLRWTGKPFL